VLQDEVNGEVLSNCTEMIKLQPYFFGAGSDVCSMLSEF